ncbi:MAG: aminoglycoside phosphotransferase [Betaproteobacteria bacterium RIFCSPLOWO2_02_FULL_63_19]|nr:MAG: aminoglycoside phosphotransferase [Betaproteobacteria bacterium RIFCSPLOWO2_02_FULL_63_19]
MERIESLRRWLVCVMSETGFEISPASSDASFRRYYRLRFDDGRPSRIAMDAPPESEDCRPYVHAAELLAAAGVHVPEVIESDLEQGFLLLTDLGDATYLNALAEAPDRAGSLYADALDALIRIQLASRPGVLPEYSRELLARELAQFPDWYCERQLGHKLSEAQRESMETGFSLLLENNLAQPQVFVHRDYHSRNLMIAQPNPGILDFQDAVFGPITYDPVSLLRDAYIEWPEAQVIDWCVRYWEKARAAGLPVAADFAQFYRDFEWMGAQRQLKVLGIFARLFHRDGKDAYLRDQPLVMRYLRQTCERYRELAPLARLLDELEPTAKSVGFTF